MICIIAGSRSVTKEEIYRAIQESGFAHEITLVVSGKCPEGGDLGGEAWGNEHGLPVDPNPADWNNLSPVDDLGIKPFIRYRNGKPYDARAGHRRNELMARKADALIAVCVNGSHGTSDMVARAGKHCLRVHVLDVER